MNTLLDIIISGLTVGALYAVGTVALSVLWGNLGMLNMAHGAMLGIGGYSSYVLVNSFDLPWWLGLPCGMAGGLVVGLLLYYLIVRWMFEKSEFTLNIIIATIGVALLFESLTVNFFGGQGQKQPFIFEGFIRLGKSTLPYQTLVIIGASVVLMLIVGGILRRTNMGLVIRASAQDRAAASLMGVPTRKVMAQVMALAGVVTAVSGVMVTSLTTFHPSVGHDPMLRALIFCCVAGLGNINGAVYVAFALGLFEMAIQYTVAAQFGLPTVLALVILLLIWRPEGLFGHARVSHS